MEDALDGIFDEDVPPGVTDVSAAGFPPLLPFANPFLPAKQNVKTNQYQSIMVVTTHAFSWMRTRKQ